MLYTDKCSVIYCTYTTELISKSYVFPKLFGKLLGFYKPACFNLVKKILYGGDSGLGQ